MRKIETYTLNQLRDYSSLFSRSAALQWLEGDFEIIDYKIERYDRKWIGFKNATYLKYLRHIYSVIRNNYKNEYVYKNEFLSQWLINELGESNSKIYNEFRVGNSIADLAIFNGSSKVFEIKTELDSDSRLKMQIENYRYAFNYLYIIIPESNIDLYSKTEEGVGIIIFNSDNKNYFELYRKASFNQFLDSEIVMHILHTKEYKQIVSDYYGKLPNELTSFNQFRICMNLVKKIPNDVLNAYFIKSLKERDKENVLSNRFYKEFNQLTLSLDLNKEEKGKMIEKLKSPINI